jgi:hypothetical protein
LPVGLALLASGAPAWAQSEPSGQATVADTGRFEAIEGKLEGMTEQLQTLQADTDKLKKFKFSGYVQARWETAENSSDSVRAAGGATPAYTPANVNRFYIRRGRLKLTYDAAPLSQAVVYIDGGQDRTIRLLEAYVMLLDPWTADHRHQLWIGQMNVPFGYEIERSSSTRELPERSRAENVLFPGERDRGIKLVTPWTPRLETVIALMNGAGVNSVEFPTTDPTAAKDVLARARWSQGVFDVALSYYDGLTTVPLTGPDVQSEKTRLGADAQLYYELATLGGGSLKGELYRGKNVNPVNVRALTDTTAAGIFLTPGADPDGFVTDFLGGYVMWVQNLGDQFQLAARAESFDPDEDVEHDQFERLSLGLNWFYDGFSRVTVSYDIPKTDRSIGGGQYEDPKDNLWTVQFQHKF